MKLMMKREGETLIPATEHDADIFEKFRHGAWYKTDARKARNIDHHRKAFALIKLILDSQERYKNIEDLLVELKLKTGWYREHVRPGVPSPILISLLKFADQCPERIRRRLIQYGTALRKEASVVYIPKSISFADMDQLEFETFYDRLTELAIHEYGLEEAMEFI